jgi:hypothetical protein
MTNCPDTLCIGFESSPGHFTVLGVVRRHGGMTENEAAAAAASLLADLEAFVDEDELEILVMDPGNATVALRGDEESVDVEDGEDSEDD